MSSIKILFVDDEPNLLRAIKRQLHNEFEMATAESGDAGLEILRNQGPFAVIVSDMRMPEMDGIQFLSRAEELCPDTVRIMLTGNSDQSTAMDAVNEGHIFRFLTKPCATKVLRVTLKAGINQFRLVCAERELLDQTLHGSIKLVTDILSMTNPAAFGRGTRTKRYVKPVMTIACGDGGLDRDALRDVEIATMLSRIGLIALPPAIVTKVGENGALTQEESLQYASYPKIGCELVTQIPRLETVAEIIAHQHICFDGSESPAGAPSGSKIPFGARVLKVIQDFDVLVEEGERPVAAIALMKDKASHYDPQLLRALERYVGLQSKYEVAKIRIVDAAPGMILADDVHTKGGELLIAKGFELNPSIIHRLRSFSSNGQLLDPIHVLVPVRERQEHPEGVVA